MNDIIAGLQQLISAAVTPVVLISACATLVLVINAKHSSLSDRMRAQAAEYRQTDCTETRRKQILDQLHVFQRRFRLTYLAHMALIVATIVFIMLVIIILFTERRIFESGAPTITLFLTGVGLMLFAMCCELAEISLSMLSLKLELNDIVAEQKKQPEKER